MLENAFYDDKARTKSTSFYDDDDAAQPAA
jgi:hypothetical protein